MPQLIKISAMPIWYIDDEKITVMDFNFIFKPHFHFRFPKTVSKMVCSWLNLAMRETVVGIREVEGVG